MKLMRHACVIVLASLIVSTGAHGESLVGPLRPGETTVGIVSDQPTSKTQSSACFSKLEKLAKVLRVSSPISTDTACVIDDPVQMLNISGIAPVTLPAKPVLDCPFALALAQFTQTVLNPTAQKFLATTVTTIQSGEGFICRRRNNKPDGKLSEHAFGNAIDIVSLKFQNGENTQIQDAAHLSPAMAEFQNMIRTKSCEYFTTVLGPGSNAAHATHFHFDLGRSKGNPNPYRICE